jgi:hypothetical protein
MQRSKVLAVFLILTVALAGGLQAASLLPHAHGNDFNHSAHSTCPVHQAQQGHFFAVDNSAPPQAPEPFFSSAPVAAGSFPAAQTLFFQEYLRAPPVSF